MLQLERVAIQSGTFFLGADFALAAGELCAVLGPSGAGKTTLLNVIAGFEPLVSGRVLVEGRDFSHAEPGDRPVSMVFQDYNVFAHLDLWSNVALGIRPDLRLSDAQRQSVDAALAHVGLSGLARRRPADVSGGERQRVALARVLVRDSKVLLLDEPCSALDPISTGKIEELITELKSDYTVIIVTHNMQQAARCSDYTTYMYLGDLIEFGPTAELFMKPKKKDTEDYITGRFG